LAYKAKTAQLLKIRNVCYLFSAKYTFKSLIEHQYRKDKISSFVLSNLETSI